MDTGDDGMLTMTDIADLAGVKRDTINSYRTRGRMPPPDAIVLGHPVWRRDTVEAWLADRPGRGARTDLTG